MLYWSFFFRVPGLALQLPEVFFMIPLELALLPLFLPAAFPVNVGDGGVGGGIGVIVFHMDHSSFVRLRV